MKSYLPLARVLFANSNDITTYHCVNYIPVRLNEIEYIFLNWSYNKTNKKYGDMETYY